MNDTTAVEISDGELIWSYVYLGIVMAIGIPGNALILFVVSSVHVMSDVDNYILSLAANDLAFCCLCVPTDIMLFNGYLESINSNTVVNIFCKTKVYIRCVLSTTESLILCLIALDRYYRVVRLHSKFFLSSNSKVGSIGCFCIAVCIAVPNVIITWDAADLQCRQGEDIFNKLYIMFLCVLSVFVSGTPRLIFFSPEVIM
ncbi:hypothetical protein ACJMK2_019299 [Sinanodonta woodiana]|uniref:G-protein coupled receptors family 1 profile domain-containing protein n=1 Tax=Sinanodonta woodiana TaxID=1069815 RepID=A0ABD3UHF5_SINWO